MSQLPVLLAVAMYLVLGESTRPATSNIRQYIFIITVEQWHNGRPSISLP